MFCSNCGYEIEKTANICPNCGFAVEPEEAQQGGMEQQPQAVPTDEKKFDTAAEFDKLKGAAVDTLGKALVGAQKVANNLTAKVEELKRQQEEEEKRRKEEEEKRRKEMAAQKALQEKRNAMGQSAYMSSTELWSWLKQSAKRQMFYTEQPSEITEADFMDKISQKILCNGVPAEIEMRRIQWDRSKVHKTSYFVRPFVDVVNPLTCLIQFNHVGNFTFVEEKTFITPPNLPPVPHTPKEPDSLTKSMTALLLYGAIAAFIGFLMILFDGDLGFPLITVGGFLCIVGFYFKNKLDCILAWNESCKQEEKEWADAWKNWQNTIFLHSFQEDINGQLSRVYESVFECIKQVSDEELTGSSVVEQQESANINELEELIARRKEEYR